MAYMDQAKKALIVAELKSVMPAGWKYSVGVRNYMSITLTISAAPVDLLGAIGCEGDYCQVNTHGVVENLRRRGHEELAETFDRIIDALNYGNHDNSDIQTDYFDVGHYVDLDIGRWNKPFVNTAAQVAA